MARAYGLTCTPFSREFCTPESESMLPTKQLTFLMITLLVLFSTLCPAGDHHEQIPPTKLSCLVRNRWNAVCIHQPPDLNVAAPERSVDTAYSLESSVQVDVSLNLTFMDPVVVLCHLAMGSIIFMLLGWICWIILILVWCTCSAATARINPIYTIKSQHVRFSFKESAVKHEQIYQGNLIH